MRRRRTALIALGAAAVLALTGWLVVAFSPAFAITSVEITGTKLLTPDAVAQTAAVSLGTSLALVDTDAVAGRVRGLAPVAQVAVTRRWPATLRIEVTERTAVVAVRSWQKYFLADSAGVVFDEADTIPPGLVEVVVAPTNTALLADTWTVHNALDPSVRALVRLIEADTRDSITVVLITGVRVIWGDVGKSELKSQVLDALIDSSAKVIDVSSPANPATR